MKRIFIIVEGETEERFVRRILYPHFINLGIHLEPELWVTNRKTGSAGGGRSFDLIENHLRRRIQRYSTDTNVYISTMIDLYRFPRQGNTVYDEDVILANSGINKKTLLEEKLYRRFSFYRFIPYIQLHEFEALLYSDISKLVLFYTDKQYEISQLACATIGISPEDINDRIETSPSHRIIDTIPVFEKQKATVGPTIADAIGLNLIREKCPEFDKWVKKMETI